MDQTTQQNISILLLEDDINTQERFVQALSQEPGFHLSAIFRMLAPALQWLKSQSSDVLLADLSLPDGSGLDAIRYCNQHYPHMDIMVLSVHDDPEMVAHAIQAGATGYLLKDIVPSTIGPKVHELRNGGAPMSPSIARVVLKQFRNNKPHTPQGAESNGTGPVASEQASDQERTDRSLAFLLTEREKTVLKRMSQGFSYREIANLERVSVHTIHAHIKKIYMKLNVHSRSEAVFEAVHMGLLTLDRKRP